MAHGAGGVVACPRGGGPRPGFPSPSIKKASISRVQIDKQQQQLIQSNQSTNGRGAEKKRDTRRYQDQFLQLQGGADMRTQVLFLTFALLAVLAQSSSNRHHHHHSHVQSKGTGSSLCSRPAKSRFFFSTSESRKGIAFWVSKCQSNSFGFASYNLHQFRLLGPLESVSGFRAWRGRRRRGASEPGEGGGAGMAVLRQLRRVHQVDPAAVPVPGRGAPRVPPGVQGLRQVQPQRRPAGVPVHGPRPQLLRPPLHHRRRRRPLTAARLSGTTDWLLLTHHQPSNPTTRRRVLPSRLKASCGLHRFLCKER